MEDPIRPEAIESIRISQNAGIRVIMITGDHIDTAIAIGRKLGLDKEEHGALEGKVLDQMSDKELDMKLQDINIYARVTPQHKYRIVERLKKFGHIVAVTGDGVNDAPALRTAHLGIAMGKTGTYVAREASDMVLSDDNFATITAAIEVGILTGRLAERLVGVGIVLAIGTLGILWWAMEETGGDVEVARTVAMTQMVVFQFFHVLNCRSLDRSLLTINFFSNKFLFVSFRRQYWLI